MKFANATLPFRGLVTQLSEINPMASSMLLVGENREDMRLIAEYFHDSILNCPSDRRQTFYCYPGMDLNEIQQATVSMLHDVLLRENGITASILLQDIGYLEQQEQVQLLQCLLAPKASGQVKLRFILLHTTQRVALIPELARYCQGHTLPVLSLASYLDDRLPLARYLLNRYANSLGRAMPELTTETETYLLHCDWFTNAIVLSKKCLHALETYYAQSRSPGHHEPLLPCYFFSDTKRLEQVVC